MTTKRIPAAVTKYCREFEESEQDVRDYILRQIEFYNQLQEKSGQVEQWIGFKLGCSAAAAATAIKWAKGGAQ